MIDLNHGSGCVYGGTPSAKPQNSINASLLDAAFAYMDVAAALFAAAHGNTHEHLRKAHHLSERAAILLHRCWRGQ